MEGNRKGFFFYEWTLFPLILLGVVLTHEKNTYWKELYLGGDLCMFSLRLVHITYLVERSRNALFVMQYKHGKFDNTWSIQVASNVQSSGYEWWN